MVRAMLVVPVPCLSDNYAYLLICPETNEAAIIDPSEAAPVLAALESRHVRVVSILATHHHPDHVGGIEALVERLKIEKVYGHKSDKGRIPGQTHFLEEDDSFHVGSYEVNVLHIPGHTTGAVAYVVSRRGDTPVVFTGDTLFVAGCGRLFEGNPPMMHASLMKLALLEPRTRVYCGHEYTESNLRFAAHVEPSNAAVEAARERVAGLRAEGKPTVPSTIAEELAFNPFMRVHSQEIRANMKLTAATAPADVLGAVRAAKDSFK